MAADAGRVCLRGYRGAPTLSEVLQHSRQNRHILGIFVDDLHTMAAFHRDALGFEIDWDGHGPFAEFKNDGVRFFMYKRSELGSLLGKEPGFRSWDRG